MEGELKKRVDEYVQANSVKVVPPSQKEKPANVPKNTNKAPKDKKKKESVPAEKKEEAPAEAPAAAGEVVCSCFGWRHLRRSRISILGLWKLAKEVWTMTNRSLPSE